MKTKKINERPFELVGFTAADYLSWCEENKKKARETKTKKEFFKLVYEFKLVKKDGKVIDLSKGE